MTRWFLLVFLVLALPARAVEFDRLVVTNEGPRYIVDGEVRLDAEPEHVYAVLTDYNHLDWITGAVLESRLLERLNERSVYVLVRTEICMAFYCREVDQVQRIDEEPPWRVTSYAIADRSDVAYGRAQWTIDPDGPGTRLTWHQEFEPDFWVPPVIGPGMVRAQLEKQGRRSIRGVELLARRRAQR